MENNVVTAGVNINVSDRVSGDVQSGMGSGNSKVLQQILVELKKANLGNDVSRKKAASGFGSEAAAGVAKLLKNPAIAAAVAAMGGSAAMIWGSNPSGENGLSESDFQKTLNNKSGTPIDFPEYVKAIQDGKEVIVELDSITGEVVKVISMKKAVEMDILTKSGEIRESYKNYNDAQREVLKNTESIKGKLILHEIDLDESVQHLKTQNELDILITEAKRKKLRSLGGNDSKVTSSGSYFQDLRDDLDALAPSTGFNLSDPGSRISSAPLPSDIAGIEQSRVGTNVFEGITTTKINTGSLVLDSLLSNFY
jgi:hypothetical protein